MYLYVYIFRVYTERARPPLQPFLKSQICLYVKICSSRSCLDLMGIYFGDSDCDLEFHFQELTKVNYILVIRNPHL